MPSHWHQTLRSVQLGLSKLAVFFASFSIVRLPNLLFTLSDLLFVGAAFLLFSTIRVPRDPYGPGTSAFLVFLSLLSGGILVSSLFASVPERAMAYILQYAFAYGVLAYVISAESYETIVELVKWYLAGLLIGLVIAFYWYWTEPTPNLFVTGNGRFKGMNGGPNDQAAVIGLSLPLLFYLWMQGRWPLVVLFVTLMAMIYGLVTASSNNGLMATFAAILVFFVLTLTLQRMIKAACILAAVVPLLLYSGVDYLPETFKDRVLAAVQSGDLAEAGSFSYRIALISEGLDMLDDTIFLGIGADQFRVVSSHRNPVHNTYLLLWTEGGLISLLAWLGIIAVVATLGFASLRHEESRLEGATATAIAFTLLVIAISVTHLYPRTWTTPLMLALGLVVSRYRLRKRHTPRPAAVVTPELSIAARVRQRSLSHRHRIG